MDRYILLYQFLAIIFSILFTYFVYWLISSVPKKIVSKVKSNKKESLSGFRIVIGSTLVVPSLIVYCATLAWLFNDLTVANLVLIMYGCLLPSALIWFLVKNIKINPFVMFVTLLSLAIYVILCFSILYLNPSEDSYLMYSNNQTKINLTFSNTIYYSGTTFFTIGYGDIVPVGKFRFYSIIEPFFNAYLILFLITYGFYTLSRNKN